MGGKASTPATPNSEDSSSSQPGYSSSDRQFDHDEQPARPADRQERSFMERAETSLQNFIQYSTGGTSSVDIHRSSRGEHQTQARLTSSFDETGHSGGRHGSAGNDASRSHSIGSISANASGQPGSASSSVGSNSGLGHFFSSFGLWRQSSQSASDRQRAQSLSNMPEPELLSPGHAATSNRSRYDATEEASSFSNPRAMLSRLLSSRDSRNSASGAHNATGAESSQQSRRDNALSVRDFTFSTAQEFLTEATLNGLGRVYVTHSLPSHMWAVNGNASFIITVSLIKTNRHVGAKCKSCRRLWEC